MISKPVSLVYGVKHLLQHLLHVDEVVVLQLGVDHLRDEEGQDLGGDHVDGKAVALVR